LFKRLKKKVADPIQVEGCSPNADPVLIALEEGSVRALAHKAEGASSSVWKALGVLCAFGGKLLNAGNLLILIKRLEKLNCDAGGIILQRR
jgi:hypothetical protein